MELRYGINPGQDASAVPVVAGEWPMRVVHGEPSFINLLDALNSWQLVREASQSLGKPAAASFKHVSPAGAAVAGPVDEVAAGLYGVDSGSVGELTSAYLRARDADPKSSYGDFAAVSHPVDGELAEVLGGLVCDGIIAPGYEPGTVERLGRKKKGRFLVIEADQEYVPPREEAREVYGVRLTQERSQLPQLVANQMSQGAVHDLQLGMAVSRFTQSNSVCYVRGGMTIGIGAGQQSRVDCTRLAGAKADIWWLRRHPAIRGLVFRDDLKRQERINWQIRWCEGDLTTQEIERLKLDLVEPPQEVERAEWLQKLDDVAFVSDGALPFRDNVDHAQRHGVRYIAEPGGSIRSDEVAQACAEYGITLTHTTGRLFHH
ncbi:phosphoribosylaminoimidazolecarboxamide formyltransferase/IMP cyclohydrolase [Kribbella voronezhensis]|uniref:Phosphoribosylaminoimidazolecarboxamide formyltransferase/IMP cyclohydrolase n=1 Tax=Kribbella voronezhensis TaxID=2512212 RepID=A0A4V3FII2_9ACTN|nr:phosphoribosylaminoimidazolecarboxamide formyltransferase [Kribbella voronezhensis]TDU82543.1 phosphoribosylaminoimidazolecarboxamide formyltransferase/IMP cyclohydrolase [Kribbella voronezhensis]